MPTRIAAALLTATLLTAGTARGEVYLGLGEQGIGGYWLYQGYTAPTLLHSGGGPLLGSGVLRYVALADFNGDGFPDLAESDYVFGGNFAGSVSVIDGKTWSGIAYLKLNNSASPFQGGFGAPIAAGDVNGDGIPDLIVGPNPGGFGPDAGGYTQIHVYSGKDWTQLPLTYAPNGNRVATADFNHDGKSDIITSGTVYDAVSGNVLFTFPQGGLFAAGDVDGDGTPDIAVGGYNDVPVYSGVDRHLIKTATFHGLSDLTLADVNQDGYADFVGFNYGSGLEVISGLDLSVLSDLELFARAPGLQGNVAAYVTGASAAAVPEPATLSAMFVGALGLLIRRRPR